MRPLRSLRQGVDHLAEFAVSRRELPEDGSASDVSFTVSEVFELRENIPAEANGRGAKSPRRGSNSQPSDFTT